MRRCRGLLSGLIVCLTLALIVFISKPATDSIDDPSGSGYAAEFHYNVQTTNMQV